MLINAFSYWCVAFGLGYGFAHHAGFGVEGLWFGLIIGLTLSSALLGARVAWVVRRYDRIALPPDAAARA